MPLTPTETKALLEEMGHRPDKRLGQNFLVDGNLVRKSMQMADLPPESTVVEVGPGLGALTGALLDAGHCVYAVEREPVLVKHLRACHADALEQERLDLFGEDAMDFPLARLPAEKGGFQIVANLPYAIASPWLEAVLAGGSLPTRMVLMLQKEAALRYQAEAGSKNYGALTIFLAAAYEVADQHPVSRTCFYPKPEVDSVLLRLDRKEPAGLFPKETRELIRRLFTRRRKQIGGLARTEEPAIHKAIEEWLEDQELSTALRPEQIPPECWWSLRLS
ncbi:MAG: ribosomal RNA small subunit methyltransferase A [Opitutae bacterium]|nr:ribosomal RNA small subunit methyltransferase A [Opitutae bacterium]